jgi:SAM-dependent methyltransferase
MTNSSDVVAAQYRAYRYPEPIADMEAAIRGHRYYDLSDPSLYRRKLWPRNVEPDGLDILVAGCGTNQAAALALTNRRSRVTAIDLSVPSLTHEQFLKDKHGLENLSLHRLDVEQCGALGRTFDLIVCTGVLHHLTAPGAGLRALGRVLRPHGVMSIMLYGYYPRVGVYMLQELFRVLDLQQDAEGIEVVRQTLGLVPGWHHVKSYKAQDLAHDSGIVDTFLHRRDRAYTVPRVLRFVRANGFAFQGWLDRLPYSVSARFSHDALPLRTRLERLPIEAQWRAVELIAQAPGRHFFLACHADRPKDDYQLDFTTNAWLDYVPEPRPPFSILKTQHVPAHGVGGDMTVTFRRDWHSVDLTPLESALLTRANGQASIRQIVKAVAVKEDDEPRVARLAQSLFQRMADWDHLQFRIP